jgi:multisubunit Na+/H+ antiporter MnhB subunit
MKRITKALASGLFFISSAVLAAAETMIPIGTDQFHVDTVTAIITGIAVGLAAVMAVLNAFKWITSDDAQDRLEAKKALIIILVALLMLMLAGALVGLFFDPTFSPGY